MNRTAVVAMVAALMLGSGIAGYLIGTPDQSVDPTPPPRTATTVTPAPAVPPSAPATTPTPAPASQPAVAPAEPFSYRRVGIDSSRAEGEACLYFNKPLVADDSVKYGDYFLIEPEVKSTVRAVDVGASGADVPPFWFPPGAQFWRRAGWNR